METAMKNKSMLVLGEHRLSAWERFNRLQRGLSQLRPARRRVSGVQCF